MPYDPPNNSVKTNTCSSHLVSLLSVVTIGIALISGVWLAYNMLRSGPNIEDQALTLDDPSQNRPLIDTTDLQNNVTETDAGQSGIPAKAIVIGLLYLAGLALSLLGIRDLGNSWLPFVIKIYAWFVLSCIILLQLLILLRLYRQDYHFLNYIKYLFVFGAGLIALVGLHVVLERHSLMPFGVAILLTGLFHLYLMVQHYVFATEVNYAKVWGDLGFFLVTTFVGILMVGRSRMSAESETS